jgi:hypothetical protein
VNTMHTEITYTLAMQRLADLRADAEKARLARFAARTRHSRRGRKARSTRVATA